MVSENLKKTILMGAVGAAAIFVARQVKTITPLVDGANIVNNGKNLPVIPEDLGKRNGWGLAFVAIPAVGAWYLSR